MKIKNKIVIAGIIILLIMLGYLSFLYIKMNGTVFPKKDTITCGNIPDNYMITTENIMDYQLFNDCAGYSIAYVLRSLGQDAEGTKVYNQIAHKQKDGSVELKEAVSFFRAEGYQATLYKGSVDTLKARISKGIPVIVFIKSSIDQEEEQYHYTVAVGYDEKNIYLSDSVFNLTNERTDYYNRKLSIDEFEEFWNLKEGGSRNIYIYVNS